MHSLATAAPVPTALAQVDREKIYQWINELSSPETRENALLELSKKRESVPDLAPMLWHSFGTIAALLQEIVNIYPSINPPTLTAHQSNRVCNALALLQCVASHPETRSAFLAAHIPLFLYPFLHTVSKTRPFEYLRLTSLGVIGALVKTDEQEVINFLLTTEIIPLCLRIMESGSELSKTVATFILQKILLDDTGLAYICQTYERFSHVAMILGKMVLQLSKEPSARLLKHVVRCYLRLSDNPRRSFALVAQAGVQWHYLDSPKPPPPGNSPASASRVAGTTGMRHYAQLIFVFLVETGFHHVGQDGFDLLTS
ncbi:CCR4-NOT transcription complex subunit 9 [Plecturocebus cupreus]